MNYLDSVGIQHKPWQHQFLYDVFQSHAQEYAPHASSEAKHAYYISLARRVLECVALSPAEDAATQHATKIWELIGPSSLELYPEVHDTLLGLRRAGYRLALISNWQCGLGHFCVELGIGHTFDHILASAELGHAKPAREIFDEATRRLGVAASETLLVGDSREDDFEGARAAGLNAVLIDRERTPPDTAATSVRTLSEVADFVARWPGSHG